MRVLQFVTALIVLIGCQTAPVKIEQPSENAATTAPETIQENPSEPPLVVVERIPLSWENDNPARAGWSDRLMMHLEGGFEVFGAAKDTKRFCPKYGDLNDKGRLQALGEFLVALAYYESAWNPKSASVDVGVASKKDTYSVGLYQVSVVDQEWSGGGYHYAYDELLQPSANIDLAMAILFRQVKRNGLFILPNSHKDRYWAVMLDGNKYSQIPGIIARVKKYAPGCN